MLNCRSQNHELNLMTDKMINKKCCRLGESLLDYLFRTAFPSYTQQETKNWIPSQNGWRLCWTTTTFKVRKDFKNLSRSHLKNKTQICHITSAFSYGSFGVDHRDHSDSEGQQGRVGLWRGSAGAIFKNKRFSHRKHCSKEQSSGFRLLLIKLQISPNNHIFPWACIQQPFCKIFTE